MTIGTPDAIASRNGSRSASSWLLEASISLGSRSVFATALPKPGKCFAAGITPPCSRPFANATPAATTARGSPPKARAEMNEEGEAGTSSTGARSVLIPSRARKRPVSRPAERPAAAPPAPSRAGGSSGGPCGRRLTSPPSWSIATSSRGRSPSRAAPGGRSIAGGGGAAGGPGGENTITPPISPSRAWRTRLGVASPSIRTISFWPISVRSGKAPRYSRSIRAGPGPGVVSPSTPSSPREIAAATSTRAPAAVRLLRLYTEGLRVVTGCVRSVMGATLYLDGRRHCEHAQASAAGCAAWLLRGRRSCRADGRARPRPLRPTGLCAQGDRAQQARGAAAREAGRDLRRSGDRGAGGRAGRLLGPRRGAERSRQRRRAPAPHDRRYVSARHQGPRGGAQVRGPGLHDRPHRAPGPRGGRGNDRRGAGEHRAGPDRGGCRQPRGAGSGPGRLHHADHPVGGRDHGDHREAEAEVPRHRRPQDR